MNATNAKLGVFTPTFPVSDWLQSFRDQFRDDPNCQEIVALCALIFKGECTATIERANEVLAKALEDLRLPA